MRCLLVTLLCLLAVGCRSDLQCSRQTALLRAEILDLEDKYYALKMERGLSGDEVDSEVYYDESGVIYDDGGIVYDDDVIYENNAPLNRSNLIPNPPEETTRETSRGSSILNPQDDENSIDLQMDSSMPTNDPQGIGVQDDQTNLSLNSPSVSQATSTRRARSPQQRDIAKARNLTSEIVISTRTTRGRNLDGLAGDEGLDLMIFTRNAAGRMATEPGELTVSLIDPTESAEFQQIGIWKFLPSETKLFLAQPNNDGMGILLHLPWDQSTPQNSNLDLHVRFKTPDGRSFQTSRSIHINPPAPNYSPDDPTVTAWLQNDPRWISGSESQPTDDIVPLVRKRSSIPTMRASTIRRTGPVESVPPKFSPPTKAEVERPEWRPIR